MYTGNIITINTNTPFKIAIRLFIIHSAIAYGSARAGFIGDWLQPMDTIQGLLKTW
jgi:hypothetical protein